MSSAAPDEPDAAASASASTPALAAPTSTTAEPALAELRTLINQDPTLRGMGPRVLIDDVDDDDEPRLVSLPEHPDEEYAHDRSARHPHRRAASPSRPHGSYSPRKHPASPRANSTDADLQARRTRLARGPSRASTGDRTSVVSASALSTTSPRSLPVPSSSAASRRHSATPDLMEPRQRSRHRRARRPRGSRVAPNVDEAGNDTALTDDEASDGSDLSSFSAASGPSAQPMTVRERQTLINTEHPFGLRLWKHALYKKTRGIDRATEQDVRARVTSPFLSPGLLASPPGALRPSPSALRPSRASSMNGGASDVDFDLDAPFAPGSPLPTSADMGATAEPIAVASPTSPVPFFSIANLLWATVFGLPLAIAYFVAAIIVLFGSLGGARLYSRRLFALSGYWLWPFGRDIHRLVTARPKPFTSWSLAHWWHAAVVTVIAAPLHIVGMTISWLVVYYVPMAKVLVITLHHTLSNPLALALDHVELFEAMTCNTSVRSSTTASGGRDSGADVSPDDAVRVHFEHLSDEDEATAATRPLLEDRAPVDPAAVPATELLICVCRSGGLRYHKFTVEGINIIFVNLIPFVLYVLLDGFVLGDTYGLAHPSLLFVLCLFATIPLAYFIGMAVASISAQSSPAIGAVLNASFGSIVEVILYCLALRQGKAELVEGSVIGTLLGCLLLLPGLSMIAGGIRCDQQIFNAKSAGVTNTMLIMTLIAAFTPTLFYQIYGTFDLKCRSCIGAECHGCAMVARPVEHDKVFQEAVLPLSYFCALILPLVYIIGLVFSLKTHRKHIYNTGARAAAATPVVHPTLPTTAATPSTLMRPPSAAASVAPSAPSAAAHAAGGHDAPEWSRRVSVLVLILCTISFALIAELLVSTVETVMDGLHLQEKFLGVTLFAIVPSITEFVNAIAFASQNNIALSLEVGSAYAVQVSLIQIPALIAFSWYVQPAAVFTMVFPQFDMYTIFFAVFLLCWIYIEGKTNYFKGSILSLAYVVLIAAFFFATRVKRPGNAPMGWTPLGAATEVGVVGHAEWHRPAVPWAAWWG
ncbi:calcium/proton exchanger [Allomyces macrogynus ATCC 38327]|uniref:Calcium/proton exchanger n=1 Tax=Allomyces macrogynus (strain ATCC 38327) TaxID=578462 RepID=A0A0L0SEY9_ALLM3|nr:calcium/proton exchanger [Allomyces macrogynus ATCC 38327]|eukprot:KNE61103.1 calcium/proton exchanger [Allomyces macrogynus ATCC 38327]